MNSKEFLNSKLNEANEYLKSIDIDAKVTIVGGSAIVLSGIIARATVDFDVISKVNSKLLYILEGFDFNDHVRGPYEGQYGNWENDQHLLKKLSNLEVMTLSPERLIAARMFSRKRFDDIEHAILNKKISLSKFEDIVEEICKETADPIYLKEFKENKEGIKKLYKKAKENYENSKLNKLYKKTTE